jgi:hypothetical protein
MTAKAPPPVRKAQPPLLPQFAGAVLVVALVAFFLPDYNGHWQGVVGVGVVAVVAVIALVTGLAYNASFLLSQEIENWYEEGYNLLWQQFSTGGVPADLPADQKEIPPSVRTFGAGVVDSHIVLALGRGALFNRAVGPGYVKLERGEYIKEVIDLREHYRNQPIQAVTRDGIPLETTLSVIFRVRRLPADLAPENAPYPHDPEAIFQLSYFSSIAENGQELTWLERVVPLVAAELVAEVANYNLDEVYQLDLAEEEWEKTALDPEKVKKEVLQRVQEQLRPHGIEVVSIALGDWSLPEHVRKQRIVNWQADWQRRAYVELAKGDAMAIQQMEEARVKTELELIRHIMDTIEGMGWNDRMALSDVVTLVAIEALEDAAADVPNLIPSQLMNTIEQLQASAPRLNLPAGDEDEGVR